MRFLAGLGAALCGVLLLAMVEAPPYISAAGVRNAASRMPPTLAGGAIAAGSLFSVRGARLGPNPPVRSEAGVLELGGTALLVNGAAVPLFYSSEDRLLALMPPGQGSGGVEVAVRRGGVTGPSRAVRVVAASPGLFSHDGALAEELPAAAVIGERPHGGPSAVLEVLGTGVGRAQSTVLVGGKRAPVLGVESAGPGIDRIRFRVPRDAPLGCEVPVLVGAAGVWSNTVPVRLETSTVRCLDASGWVAEEFSKRGRNGSVWVMRTSLRLEAERGVVEDHTFDLALAGFSESPPEDTVESFSLPPVGTCSTATGIFEMGGFLNPPATTDLNAQLLDFNVPFRLPSHRMLDAGRALSLRTASGTREVTRDPSRPEYYATVLGGTLPGAHTLRGQAQALVLNAGPFRVSGQGSEAVGAFEVESTMPDAVRWLNRDGLRGFRRSDEVTVKWANVSVPSMMLILAGSMDAETGASGLCMCSAAGRTGQFSIPKEMLANLPATHTGRHGLPTGILAVGAYPSSRPKTFLARGLDGGVVIPSSYSARLIRVD